MLKRTVVIFLFILSAGTAFGQTDSAGVSKDSLKNGANLQPAAEAANTHKYEITGVVVDKLTGEPVPFATIFFPRTPVGTTTETDGKFVLQFDELKRDTMDVQAIGYKTYKHVIKPNQYRLEIRIVLEQNASLLNEVVIHAGEPPAVTLIKNVIAKKPYNNPDKINNYRYEAYSKVEIDLLHLSRKEFEELPIPYIRKFSFIYDNLDTTSGKESFLPFFLVETLSDFYFQKDPRKSREIIKANEIRGIRNESITQYMGKMHLAVNPYDNYLLFFDKQFVSPISNAALIYYKYRILDTQKIDGYNVIRLSFRPQREGENCFNGTINIVDSVFALQYLGADLPKSANINWVNNATIYKQYELVDDSVWFCTKENIAAELVVSPDIKLPGLIGRRTTSYKDIHFNDPQVPKIIEKWKDDVTVLDTARGKSRDFWLHARHDTLSRNEKAIYNMFDTLEATPAYHRFKSFVKFLAMGVVQMGPIEIGPYWNLYSNNGVEGNRFRFSMGTTRKFSKDVYLNGYIAYGTKDERFKYNLAALWILNKHPRTHIFASYTSDIDRFVYYYDRVAFDNIFNLAIRKNGIPLKLIFSNEARFEFFKEYHSGFSYSLTGLQKDYSPYAPLPSSSIFTDDAGAPVSTVHKTEVDIRLRYAFHERFLEGNYLRISLGSKYPILEAHYAIGIKGLLNGGYNYHRVSFTASDEIKIAPLGKLYVNVFGGKYFGTLPYVLLERHPGNESYFYNKYSFSMMTLYEFISDQYAGFNVEHSIGGGVFTYIPLVRKLKLRQFWTAKGLIGSLTAGNRALNLDKGFPFRTLERQPYLEVGTGIENILRLFRVDFVWRVLPEPLPGEEKSKHFGILGSVKLDF